jgi:hypothetical protein
MGGDTMRILMTIAAIAVALSSASAVCGQSASDVPIAVYQVRHDHAVESGPGELRITRGGIEFRGAGSESDDSRVWRDADIRRLEIDSTKLRVYVYEAARVPVLPSHIPFVGSSKAIRTGTERKYEFELTEGEVSPEVVRAIVERFGRPIGTSVVASDVVERGALLFEIPVFHRHVSGGESGVLRVYERRVAFDAETKGGSREWRYSDLRDISRLGRFGFEIATYEPQRWTPGKSYVFDLERPLTDGEYEALWRRLYERSR